MSSFFMYPMVTYLRFKCQVMTSGIISRPAVWTSTGEGKEVRNLSWYTSWMETKRPSKQPKPTNKYSRRSNDRWKARKMTRSKSSSNEVLNTSHIPWFREVPTVNRKTGTDD